MPYYRFNPELVPTAQEAFVQEMLDCNNFAESDRLLGASFGRGTTWFLNTQAELGLNSVRRHYYRGGLFGKLVKDRYVFCGVDKSRAVQEFELLLHMRMKGLPVPRPIGCKIDRVFGCYQADILLEKIENTQDLSQFLQQQPLSEAEYRQIGALIRSLHDNQIHHSDLNIHNILRCRTDGSFWLIDFDKCRLQKGESWKTQNLDRLLRSFRKEQTRLDIHFNEQNWQALLAGYWQKNSEK